MIILLMYFLYTSIYNPVLLSISPNDQNPIFRTLLDSMVMQIEKTALASENNGPS